MGADEVRVLADRTTHATDEIEQSIRAIQEGTDRAVTQMAAGTERVAVGVEKAKRAGESLEHIVTGARDLTRMIESIAASAEQQSRASGQVTENIQAINAVSVESAAAASQAAQAAVQLSSKAEDLRFLVSRFQL